MPRIFVNLKRFDVPQAVGGLCPVDDPYAWIDSVIADSVETGLGSVGGLQLVYLLPEGLVHTARQRRAQYPAEQTAGLGIGCQGVHWEDIAPGKNFGAFTTRLPARAAANLGCEWAIIGHSEERKAHLQVMQIFAPTLNGDHALRAQAAEAINRMVGLEVQNALDAGLKALVCVGETAEERGDGTFNAQRPRIERVLEQQTLAALANAQEAILAGNVVIGYEPVWAIGPGKTPPTPEYIAFVAGFLSRLTALEFGAPVPVVYGGGLKEENAASIAALPSISGGLVGLTHFTAPIGFRVEGLQRIIANYLEAKPEAKA